MPSKTRPRPPREARPATLGASELSTELLLEAGAVLASSLDLRTTMGQVARLTVPRLADLCVIDLADDDGSIREAAVAARQTQLARELEALRATHPIDPQGEHPVARVIRTGEPALLPEMSSALLRSIAQGAEHAKFMLERGYRSAIVAPLPARGRTFGALSVLRLGAGEPFAQEDRELVCELARRAALALDNARLYSDLSASEQRQEAILVNLAEAITVTDARARIVFANQAALDLFEVDAPAQLSGGLESILQRFALEDEHGAPLDLESMPARRLFRGEEADVRLFRMIAPESGRERWVNVRSSAVTEAHDPRFRYVVNVFEDITEVKRAQLTESFMAEAGRVLASSTDFRATLRRVALLAVPLIADWCVVDVLDDDDQIQRVAAHHVDASKLVQVEQQLREHPPRVDQRAGIAEVIRTGRPRIYTDVTVNGAASPGGEYEDIELLRAMGATSAIIVPMAGATRTAVGAITLASSESMRRLTHTDLGLAVRLGRRAGTAVERARIYTERARIAHVLQRALLPESLPSIPGAQVHALYSAAGQLNEVGGDFYDVFEYGPGRWMLVIGDVCGKGARAAGVTALARHTLRAAALAGASPSEMLHTLHRALRSQPAGADLVTACLVTVAPGPSAARLTVVLAGHQPPLLIDGEGQVTQLGLPGTLLGVFDPLHLREVEAELAPGQTLLLYTDGVPDAGRPHRGLGEDGLRKLASSAPSLSVEGLLQLIEETALEHADRGLHDDIALLGVRLAATDLHLPAGAEAH